MKESRVGEAPRSPEIWLCVRVVQYGNFKFIFNKKKDSLSWVLVSVSVRSGSLSNHVSLGSWWEGQSTAGCSGALCFFWAVVREMSCILASPGSLLDQSAPVCAPSSFSHLHFCFTTIWHSALFAACNSCKPIPVLCTNSSGLHFVLWIFLTVPLPFVNRRCRRPNPVLSHVGEDHGIWFFI